MSKGKCTILQIILSLFFVFLTACQTTVVSSTGSGRYELERSLISPRCWETTVQKGVGPVYNAVVSGINDLGLKATVSKVDQLSGMVAGQFADETPFEIKLSYLSPNSTLISICTDLKESKVRSVQLFKAFEKDL